jgi:hypothetical protein
MKSKETNSIEQRSFSVGNALGRQIPQRAFCHGRENESKADPPPVASSDRLNSATPLSTAPKSPMPHTSRSTIEFNNARLSWTTTTGIHGDWRIIAAAERAAGAGASSTPYFLAPMVMAGDVFGPGRLPLDPPYSYQVIATSDRHVILRDATCGEARRDSDAPHAQTFSDLQVHAPIRRAEPIDLRTLTMEHVRASWPLSARVEGGTGGEQWVLEFPVQHINTRTTAAGNGFQVETGPVLLPERLAGAPGASVVGGFLLAYVFFSRDDCLDALLWGHSPGRVGPGRSFSHFAHLENLQIELFGDRT